MVKVEEIKFQGGDLKAFEVFHPSGASVKVCPFGATVYSFKDAKNEEHLFLSKASRIDASKPIRGGIPLVFPQFGAGKLPNHGFARTSVWAFDPSDASELDGNVTFSLTLKENAETLAAWPNKFKLVYTIIFSADKLTTSLEVYNTGEEEFSFQALLHTYYLLDRVEVITIDGLDKMTYVDQLQGGVKCVQTGTLKIDKETDWIYTNAKSTVTIGNARMGKDVRIGMKLQSEEEQKEVDAVVWNPWIAKSKRTGDFGDEEYHNMLCVEPGCVSRHETCAPGKSWKLTQNIQF